MTLDYVFVPAIDEANLANGMKAALNLVKEQNGHLSVCHIEQRYPANDVALAYWQASTIRAIEEEAQEQSERLSEVFRTFCKDNDIQVIEANELQHKNGVTASWTLRLADPFTEFGNMARTADLSVLCRSEKESEPLTANVRADLLVKSGVPLLNIPAETGFTGAKKVLVGWNGTVEAKRALTAAMPLLERAESVSLLSAGLKNDHRPSAEEVAMIIRHKGINAEGQDVPADKHTDQQIIDEAQNGNFDLLVIGAYSQPRWRESMFGGLTMRLMRNPPLPVFMVH